MGVDINGWVEVQDQETQTWHGVVLIEWVVERNYGMFGSLFGQRNDDGFEPIAMQRGMPPDASYELRTCAGYLERDTWKPTWIAWNEILAIDWEEEGQCPVHRYDADVPQPWTPPGAVPLEYRRWKRKEFLVDGWDTLFSVMKVLAGRYGDEGVRLIVWFDSD